MGLPPVGYILWFSVDGRFSLCLYYATLQQENLRKKHTVLFTVYY